MKARIQELLAAGKTLADFEKEAFDALQSKHQPKSKEPKTKKDPNSKLTKADGKKSKGNQKTMKKPAAAVAQVWGAFVVVETQMDARVADPHPLND